MFTTSPVTKALAELGTRAERDDGLAAVDRCARLELELRDALEDHEACAHRALRVVLVRDGRAEDGHHGVADELLERAAEALDLRLRARVVRLQPRAHVLRICGLRGRGETDEVDEEHRDDLALLARRRRLLSGRAAGQAEARPVGILLAATRTDHAHAQSVVRSSNVVV